MRKIITLYLFILIQLCCNGLSAQDNGWIGVPGFDTEDDLVLIDQTSFYGVIGAAAISYGLSEFIFKGDTNLNFYQLRTGVVGISNGTVLIENFGIEKRVSPWFGIVLELNNQQWFYPQQNISGAGVGFNTYYRWHLFGKKRISPYLEYGAGLFYGFKKFPSEGTNFTFNLTSHLGLEYTLNNQNKVRLSYGHLHHSNNDLLTPNPGEDGNGFNITFLWFWKKTVW